MSLYKTNGELEQGVDYVKNSMPDRQIVLERFERDGIWIENTNLAGLNEFFSFEVICHVRETSGNDDVPSDDTSGGLESNV